MVMQPQLFVRMIRLLLIASVSFLILCPGEITAQNHVDYSFKNGQMQLTIPHDIGAAELDSAEKRYQLGNLDLKNSLHTNNWEKAKAEGWDVDNNKKRVKLSKHLDEFEEPDLIDFIRFVLTGPSYEPSVQPGVPQMFVPYGWNKFKTVSVAKTGDSTARFCFKSPGLFSTVLLSGSFNNWSTISTPMQRTDTGWVAEIKLPPGKHLYKFIADGNWLDDPQNLQKEADGYFGYNSVYYQTNYTFRLKGYTTAQTVILAGNFNNWNESDLRMVKTATGWEFPMYLKQGTYTYKFIADRKWLHDPENPEKTDDKNGGYNSVLAFGDKYTFRLKGFNDAQSVMLAGNFNDWDPSALAMRKTADGWELPFVLGPGTYTYKFVVDGKWITDPANPRMTDDGMGTQNSLIVIKGNYTFSLSGYDTANEVLVTGSFNNWDEHAFKMRRIGDSWQFTTYLEPGKHLYKFIVDGNWIIDPANELWEENEHGTGNSVLWLTYGLSVTKN